MGEPSEGGPDPDPYQLRQLELKVAGRHQKENRYLRELQRMGERTLRHLNPGDNHVCRREFKNFATWMYLDQDDEIAKALRNGYIDLGDRAIIVKGRSR